MISWEWYPLPLFSLVMKNIGYQPYNVKGRSFLSCVLKIYFKSVVSETSCVPLHILSVSLGSCSNHRRAHQPCLGPDQFHAGKL